MPETTLRELLERNQRHSRALTDEHFASVTTGQEPAAVSVCCSDSRVSQEGMWAVDEPGWLFTPSSIGNQVWTPVDDGLVVDGSVLYPIVYTDTKVTVIVGHTGCGAITAALDAVRTGSIDAPPGIARSIELLQPVIEAGLADDRIEASDEVHLANQLVEYNVDRQVEFLLDSEDVPESESIFGFVYDFQNIYGDVPGRAYLVNVDGERDPEVLRSILPAEHTGHVHRLVG